MVEEVRLKDFLDNENEVTVKNAIVRKISYNNFL